MNTTEHTPGAAAEYLATLGLQQAPYLDSTDARFFYADPALTQRLDLLQHLTQFGDMLLGVTSPIGSGKTTLAQQFLLRGNTNWRNCSLNGAHIQHANELLVKLAECFGLQASATPERLKADLVRHCQTLRHNSQLAVVVIDDVQQLPDPALKALLELADDPRETLKLLRVILFSEAGLEQRLTATGWHSPQQPLLHNLDIPRFDERQSAAYLMYRLAVAGYSGESPFSLTEIRALHKAADGLPGKLNVLAHETLIERAGRLAARKKVPAAGSRRAPLVMALGLIGSLLAGGFAWYMSQDQAYESLAPLASAPPPAPTPKLEPADATPVPAAKPTEESQKSLETTLEIAQLPDEEDKISEKPAAISTQTAVPATTTPAENAQPTDLVQSESAPAEPGIPPPTTGAVTTPTNTPAAIVLAPETPPAPRAPVMGSPVPPPQPSAAPADVPAKPAITADAEAKTPAPGADGGAAIPAPTEKEKPQPVAAAVPATAPPPPTTPPAPAASAPEPRQPAATPTPAPATPTASASEQLGSDWLKSRSGARFTLQLLGGRSEKSLREYLRQHRIPEPVATFRTVFKGDDWYVLVHGDFESMGAARAAVATLPPTVRRGKPWARSFASVQADMQKNPALTRPHIGAPQPAIRLKLNGEAHRAELNRHTPGAILAGRPRSIPGSNRPARPRIGSTVTTPPRRGMPEDEHINNEVRP